MSDLWILAGQSNMEGCGLLQDVETPTPSVRCFAHGDYWEVAEDPLHWLGESIDEVHHMGVPAEMRSARVPRQIGAGLGLSFAKTLYSEIGIGVDLLPAAHGGTSMSQWSPDLKHSGGQSLYGALLRRTKLALETSPDSRLRGILWYQGESDTDEPSAAVYTDRMVRLVEELRSDLQSPNLPFLLVQLGCWEGNVQGGPSDPKSWESVREQQRLLPEIVSHASVVPAIDLDLDDGIHISSQGLKRLGRRLANVALSQFYGHEAPSGPKLLSVRREGTNIRVSYKNSSRMLIAQDPAGRVPGFSLSFKGGRPTVNAFYRTYIDPASPEDVLLLTAQELTPDVRLYYGADVFPFCQLTDAEDMAAPAFGPIAID